MIERIKNILNKFNDITDYRIIENKKSSAELYYVLDKLETNRLVDRTDYTVSVSKMYGDKLGIAQCGISLSYTDLDIENKIKEAISRTELSLNIPYEMPKGCVTKDKSDSNILKENKTEIALKVADAIYASKKYKDGWINSAEIFVNEKETRLINSKGADNKYVSADLFIEIIPTWKGEKEEVEIYFSLERGFIDYNEITSKVDELLENAKARSKAINLPKDLKNINVIFGAEMISNICDYLKNNLSYSSKFMHTNVLEVGEDLSKDNNVKLNLILKPIITELPSSSPFDMDGNILKEIKIIDNGKAVSLHGSSQFGQYLGIKNPTGSIPLLELECGKESFDDLKKEPYIYCVTFSSPQLDDYSGYYGGEIRLAYYFDGKNTYPVTGFSISGNLKEDFTKLRLSKEQDTFNDYKGPKYLLVPNMNIN